MAFTLPVHVVFLLVVLGAVNIYSFPLEQKETQNLLLPEGDLYDRNLQGHQNEELYSETAFAPRLPRSVQPGAPRYPGGNNNNNRNGVDVSINRQKGVGTSVNARGEYTWTGNKGNTDVRVHGQYDRVIRGPQKGNKGYNVGVGISHRW